MPVKRDSDGNVNVEPTKQHSPMDNRPSGSVTAQGQKPQEAVRGGEKSDYIAPTALRGRPGRPNQARANQQDGAHTRIYRPDSGGEATAPPEASAAPAAMQDPPVGWLVVVDGPGQGNTATLGNGVNSIGRDTSERLPLPFGDEMISRSNHATITYDPRGKKFYIQHGGGTNLTYVNNQPVLSPQELPPHTHILIGGTTLRFVPLCGDQFDWDDRDES